MNNAVPRLVGDIIVNGRMATRAECEAAIALLREMSRAGSLPSLRVMNTTEDESRAWVALHQAGCICTCPRLPSADFQWDETEITPLGVEYLRQRSI